MILPENLILLQHFMFRAVFLVVFFGLGYNRPYVFIFKKIISPFT